MQELTFTFTSKNPGVTKTCVVTAIPVMGDKNPVIAKMKEKKLRPLTRQELKKIIGEDIHLFGGSNDESVFVSFESGHVGGRPEFLLFVPTK